MHTPSCTFLIGHITRLHPGDSSWCSEYRYCAAVYALRITQLRTQPSPRRGVQLSTPHRARVCALRVGLAGDIGGDKLMDSLEQVRISLGTASFETRLPRILVRVLPTGPPSPCPSSLSPARLLRGSWGDSPCARRVVLG